MDEPSVSATHPVVKDWLAEFKSLPESSFTGYANGISDREEINDAVMRLFDSHCNNEDLFQPVCHQLFEFYRSGEKNLVNFTINLFPSMIYHHIVSVYAGNLTTPTDTLLLSIYTLSSSKNEHDREFEVPQLGNPSIYHDPISGPFSEQMFNKKSGKRYYRKPYLPSYESILPSNRYEILTHILDQYLCNISLMRKQSLVNLCNVCKGLASSGFSWQNKYLGDGPRKQRYPLSGDFMLKMVRCLYFALYNQCFSESLQAVEAINLRGKKELIPQVIFLCNAVLDSAKQYSRSNATEGPSSYGITSVNLTPALSHESMRRMGRWAATAKSIKDHKWRHHNEEISGDLTRSMQHPDIQGSSSKSSHNQESDEARSEKHSVTSPSKHIKTKLKKTTVGGVIDKSRSPAPSTGDKKNKKSNEDQEVQEKITKSSSHHKELHPRFSSASLQKHSSMDDTSLTSKIKSDMSISKSSTDVNKSSASAKVQVMQIMKDDSIPLIDQSDTDAKNESNDSDDKESYPLLSSSETPTKSKSTVEQTVF